MNAFARWGLLMAFGAMLALPIVVFAQFNDTTDCGIR